MKTLVWILIGWLTTVVWTGVASRLAPGHVHPDAAMIVVVFVAWHREALAAVVVAVVLGYLCGRLAGAPVGLHETAAVGVAIGATIASGALAAGGALFFGAAVAGATIAYHLGLFVLLYVFRGTAGFSSWATASLVLGGLCTGVVGLVSYPVLSALDRKMRDDRREGLQWR